MELYCWPGLSKWGLPSFDIASLHLMTYVKFTNANVTLVPINKSWLSKKGRVLPCLNTPSGDDFHSEHDIIQYLKLKYYEPDTWLDAHAKLNIIPFISLIEDKLIPAVKASFWLDSQNYTETTRGLYARACQYPLNFTVPQRMHQELENYLRITKSFNDDEVPLMTEKLHGDAVSALNLFSEFLGDKNYLFGKRPSSVDALLFSCLAPLFKIPLQSSKLKNHLKNCSNLSNYITRILQNHYTDEHKSEVESSGDEDEWRYDWVLPTCVATIAMLSYAINARLIQITRV